MAITPRTILTSAAPATVAVVSLYFFTVLGTAAFTCMTKGDNVQDIPIVMTGEHHQVYTSTACNHVADQFESDRSLWSEYAWANYTYCYDQNDQSEMVVRSAAEGLKYHPQSEILYNLKGVHQILLEDYAGAIDTLSDGMDNVEFHRSGQMANNLAWAGLWEPRLMRLDEARSLYIEALARSPYACELVHTGLFVEFAIASQSHGLDRYDSLKRFNDLRNRYNRCLDRLEDGDWMTVVEIVGAAVLFDNIDSAHVDDVQPLMRSAVRVLQREHGDVSIDDVCSEAMPLADFHHQCVDAVTSAIDAREALEARHKERNDRAAQVRIELVEDLSTDTKVPVIRVERQQDRVIGCGR